MIYNVNIDNTVTPVTPSSSSFSQRLEEKYPTSVETEIEYAEQIRYDEHKLLK